MEEKNKNKKIFEVDDFNYELYSPIGYKAQNVGQLVDIQTVKLVSPLVKLCIMNKGLSQMVMRAYLETIPLFQQMKRDSDVEEKKSEDDVAEQRAFNPEALAREVEVPIMASKMNFSLAMEKFKELAMAGCVLVEETKINFIQWGQISEPDLVEMFYQFVGVFIMPSLFPPQEEGKK
jgi:hypothetical protein